MISSYLLRHCTTVESIMGLRPSVEDQMVTWHRTHVVWKR